MVLPIKISIKLAGNGDVEMSKKMVFNLQKAHILMKESVNKRQRNTSYDSPWEKNLKCWMGKGFTEDDILEAPFEQDLFWDKRTCGISGAKEQASV